MKQFTVVEMNKTLYPSGTRRNTQGINREIDKGWKPILFRGVPLSPKDLPLCPTYQRLCDIPIVALPYNEIFTIWMLRPFRIQMVACR